MDVRLPNGTIIRNVPEGTTRAQLTARLKRNGYDVTSLLGEEERTFGQYAKEAFKGLIPGAVSGIETAIAGAASVLPEEAEQAVRRKVSEVAEPIRETFAPEPGYEETLPRQLSEAVGSTLPFLGAGLAGRLAAAGLGVATGAGEARQRAEQEGATEGERAAATALGIAPGALESLPPVRILRRFGFGKEAIDEVAGLAPSLRRIATAGGEEALQEASTQVLQNLIAKGVYKPEEEVFGGVTEAAGLGGGAGAIVGAIAELALGRRLRGVEPPPEAREEGITEELTEPTEPTKPAEPLALPAPRTAGYKVDSTGNVVPMTEAEAEEGARASSEFRALGLGEAKAIATRMQEQREREFLAGAEDKLRAFEEEKEEPLTPRDRILRAMAITEDRKTVDNLKLATGLPRTELRKTLSALREEGVIKFRPGKFEWELTPAGADYVRTFSEEIGSARVGRGAAVSVPPAGTETPPSAEPTERGMAGAGTPPSMSDVGEGQGEPALTEDGKRFMAEYGQFETYDLDDGAKYTGALDPDTGFMQGKGVYAYPDGTIYEGEFVKSKFQGQGKQTFPTGDIYEGEFKNDKYNGFGTLTYADGSYYKGNFKNNKFNGEGEFVDADGTTMRGMFKAGKFLGEPTPVPVEEAITPPDNIPQAADVATPAQTPITTQVAGPRLSEDATDEDIARYVEEKNRVPPAAEVTLQEGDAVRVGNMPGTIIGVEGDYVKFRPVNARREKAYQRIPASMVVFESRPSDDLVSLSQRIEEQFGEEAGELNIDKDAMIPLIGANMYGSNIADVAVKEMLQNSFDAVKESVKKGQVDVGDIDVSINDRDRTLTVKDNGVGMTPEIIRKAFFTIGGSAKELDPGETSGGLGMAKMGVLMGAERVNIDTVRDGIRTTVDATRDEIAQSNFKIRKEPASKDEHGTKITLKIPETYTDTLTGDAKRIWFPYGSSAIGIFGKPLVGPAKVTFNDTVRGEKEELPIGVNFDTKEMPKLTTADTAWGTLEVYMGTKRKKYPKHNILSSGIWQFEQPFNLSQNEKIPYDIVVNVKSKVRAKDANYPFENSRERFKPRVANDIKALQSYLQRVARGEEAKELQQSFKDLVQMPRVEAGEDLKETSKKLQKVFDKRKDEAPKKLAVPKTEEKIVISDEGVKDALGKILVSSKPSDVQREESFRADKTPPSMEEFKIVMEQDPKLPVFHNNTNVDYIEVGEPYGDPRQFFAELGTIVVEMKEALGDSGLYGGYRSYDVLKPENLFFGGISVDRSYGGIHLKEIPYKAVYLNPFYEWGAETLFGIRANMYETITHELAHTGDMSHGVGHNQEMIKVRQYLADQGLEDYFRDAILKVLAKHESVFTAMKEAYGRSTTTNTAKSLEEYNKDSSATSARGDKAGDKGPTRAVPAGARRRGNGPVSSPTPSGAKSKVRGGVGKTVREELAEKAITERTSEPLKQPKVNAAFLQSVGNSQNRLPEPTARIKEGARTAASMVPRWLRRGVFSFESTHQLADMYRPYTDKLDELWDLQNRDGAALRAKMDKVRTISERGRKVMSKYSPAARDRIYNLFLDTTVNQVEVLDSAADPVLKNNAAIKDMGIVMKPATEHSLYKQFSQLPQPVRDLYRDLRLAYLEDANEMEQILSQYLTPSEWQKLQMEFNKKRLPVYLPLYRSGEYKLVYTDKDGETVSRQFETSEEREKAFRQVRASGIPESKIVRKMASEFAASDIPPAGFYGKVVAKLRENDVDEKTIAKLFDLYMDYMPATSVLQLRRKRQNTPGYEPDVLRAYASVGGAYARRLVNMRFMPQINKAFEDLKADLGQGSFWVSYKDSKGRTVRNGYDTDELRQMAVRQAVEDGADRNSVKFFSLSDEEAADLESVVQGQIDFFNNPKLDNYASKAAYFSFTMYMGGNVSSAIIDLTHIPMVVYSLLGGKYGFGRAAASMKRAHRYYMNPNRKLPSEIAELPSVMKRATEDGILGEQRIMDLAEFNNRFGDFGSKALEVKARVDRALGSIFAISDRYNRGLTFISAYELAKNQLQKKGLKGDELLEAAYTDAKRAVYDSYGSSFPKAGPSIMQNGLARLALTFKRFALNRMWLLVKALDQATRGESKEVKNIARAQLLGFYGMAYVFSGAQGLPLMGAFQLLASALNGMFGDDDELYDIQDATRQAVGMFNYRGPINYLLGVDIASRSGWDQMLWRDDPRRIAEVGPATYAMEQMLGPAFSYAVNAPRAFEHFSEGRFSQGMETLTPRVIANMFKAFRYGTEGALTKDNIPVVDDISKYNQFMQLLGFAPTEVGEAYQQAGVAKKFEREILDRRDGLIRRAMMAIVSDDDEGRANALKDIMKFNEKHPGKPITDESISRSVTNHYVKLNQSVNGVRVDPKLAQEIYDQLGYNDETMLDESELEEQEDLATDLLYED